MMEALMAAMKGTRGILRKYLLAGAAVAASCAGLLTYDRALAADRLATLERSAGLLRQSRELGVTGGEVAAAAEALRKKALNAMERAAAPPRLAPHVKFLAALAPWLLLMFLAGCQAENWFERLTNGTRQLLMAVGFALVGACLPDSPEPWVNLVAYPLGHFAVVLAVLVLAGLEDFNKDEFDKNIAEDSGPGRNVVDDEPE